MVFDFIMYSTSQWEKAISGEGMSAVCIHAARNAGVRRTLEFPPYLPHPHVAVNFLSLAAGRGERAWLNKCLRDDIQVLASAIAPSEGPSLLTLSVCILLFAQLLSTLLIELFRITKRIRKA